MSDKYIVTSLKNGETILMAWRSRNIYVANLGTCYAKDLTFLNAQDDATDL